MAEEQYLTVTALTKYIEFKFDCDKHLQNVMLQGEISNFKHHSKGHFYFTLKDDNAQISCMMFASSAAKVLFEPKDGQKVFIKGRVRVYISSGTYQIYVTEMRSDGIGDLYLRYEQLKKELEEEGFFRPERKREIKAIPSVIGVVTSPTGAAIRDIINTVKRRYPFCQLILYPALVQGIEAKDDIARQIINANNDRLCDTLIVGRGGGSIEDLWAFNERVVAEAIYNSKIPIISAVGHEVDFTIADFVADKRAATPTAGAELATPSVSELKEKILHYVRLEKNAVISKIDSYKQKLMHIDQRIETSSPTSRIKQNKKDLKSLIKSLELNMKNKLYDERQLITSYDMRVKGSNPLNLIEHKKNDLKNQIIRLNQAMNNTLDSSAHRFNLQKEKLEALNPLSIMDKGYSIPRHNGKVVKSVKDIKKSDEMVISLKDGKVTTKVVEVEDYGKRE